MGRHGRMAGTFKEGGTVVPQTYLCNIIANIADLFPLLFRLALH